MLSATKRPWESVTPTPVTKPAPRDEAGHQAVGVHAEGRGVVERDRDVPERLAGRVEREAAEGGLARRQDEVDAADRARGDRDLVGRLARVLAGPPLRGEARCRSPELVDRKS